MPLQPHLLKSTFPTVPLHGARRHPHLRLSAYQPLPPVLTPIAPITPFLTPEILIKSTHQARKLRRAFWGARRLAAAGRTEMLR